MQGWVLMFHRSWVDWTQARGDLVGSLYSDIESACRVITDDRMTGSRIVNIEYTNGGDKALLTTESGELYGAYLMKMPMREDVPTKW